jgi:hypothetical protein
MEIGYEDVKSRRIIKHLYWMRDFSVYRLEDDAEKVAQQKRNDAGHATGRRQFRCHYIIPAQRLSRGSSCSVVHEWRRPTT